MRIFLDNAPYWLDIEKIANHIKAIYSMLDENASFTLKNGKKIDFGRKSLLRLGLKQCISTFLVPIMRDLYEAKGMLPPPYVKHSDVIEYFINGTLDFFSMISKTGVLYVESVETPNGYDRNIISISTTRKTDRYLEVPKSIREETKEKFQVPGRGTLVYSGEDWNGQDTSHKENNQEKT